jgi:hypothetical protein
MLSATASETPVGLRVPSPPSVGEPNHPMQGRVNLSKDETNSPIEDALKRSPQPSAARVASTVPEATGEEVPWRRGLGVRER